MVNLCPMHLKRRKLAFEHWPLCVLRVLGSEETDNIIIYLYEVELTNVSPPSNVKTVLSLNLALGP